MDSSQRKIMNQTPAVAGVKRPCPVPTLLPAFEPFSSSPPLPRPAKRVARESPTLHRSPRNGSLAKHRENMSKYPTPVPTSSTGIISSSPPQLPRTRRAGLRRTVSTVSERAPLASVPTIELDAGGEEIAIGRSGKASTYQLSTNKLISRVHLRAAYVPADPPGCPTVELVCTGWNGAMIHCQGKKWDLGKDDTFTSESQDADIMIDVQDARVILQWPRFARKANTPTDTDSGENSPRRDAAVVVRNENFSSPLRQRVRLASPISPSPAISNALVSASAGLFGPRPAEPLLVQIYEDVQSDDVPGPLTQPTQSTQHLSQPLGTNLAFPQASEFDNYSDQDEENDPVIHSFGPFGANLLPRMASVSTGANSSFQATSTFNRDSSAGPASFSSPEAAKDQKSGLVINHVVNQLAFSRLSSTPLSTIRGNLPSDLKYGNPGRGDEKKMSLERLKAMIDDTKCIGKVIREGKDAAGKPLESEYYYVPSEDFDESRRDAVVDGLQKPGLRACRKQHKQYYWRKPK